MVFIVQGDVIENVFVFDEHAAHAIHDDDREFITERGIIRQTGRNGASVEEAVAVLMLQALAVQA